MTETVYMIQWKTKNETWFGDIYEDEITAYQAIEKAIVLNPIGIVKDLSGKIVPVILHTSD